MPKLESGLGPQGLTPVEPNVELVRAAEAESAAEVDAGSAAAVPPHVAAGSAGEYLRAWTARVRGGDSGQLPVIFALLVVAVGFEIWSGGLYFRPDNLVNLFVQSMVFMTLAMAEVFMLLLAEIDLSLGYVMAVGAVITGNLVQSPGAGWPWWLAVLAALAACAGIGALQGTLVAVLHWPSFVVTLAGFLIWWGVMLFIIPANGVSVASPILHDQHVLYELVNGNIPPAAGWIGLAVLVALFGAGTWLRDASRRRNGLVAPPPSVTALRIAFVAAVGAGAVAICNVNRGVVGATVEGTPWAVLIVLAVLLAWGVLLQRTRYGRYVYAIGGNPEAARRAGISLVSVRIWGFVLCSLTGGIAGVLYLSWQAGISSNIQGGSLVLYSIAGAVIGGTSLFGGRGKVVHGVLGGLVIGAINNGLFLKGIAIQGQLVATGVVLLAAIGIDTLSRRGSLSGSVTRV